MKKACTKCGEEKPLDCFQKRAEAPDKRQSWCKSCFYAWKKKYAARPEVVTRMRAYGRERSATVRARYDLLKGRNKRNGFTAVMSFDEYSISVDGAACDYCERALPEKGVGLDRLNNKQGYVVGNVVPCCGVCNTARSDNFTHEEFKIVAEGIRKVMASREAS